MMQRVKLTREIRFGLHETDVPVEAANGFAGHPPLVDVAPFLIFRATVGGAIEPATGMLVNIKVVDAVLREHAIPLLWRACYAERRPVAGAMPELFAAVTQHLPGLEELALALSPFLSLSVIKKEPHMVRLSQRFEFSAAHRLHSEQLSEERNREVFDRCNNPNGHGHNYEVEVTVSGVPGETFGHVIAIPELQKIVKEQVIDRFDHKHLNLDCAEFKKLNPTVENIAIVIYKRLSIHIPLPARLANVRVWETPKTFAEYTPDPPDR